MQKRWCLDCVILRGFWKVRWVDQVSFALTKATEVESLTFCRRCSVGSRSLSPFRRFPRDTAPEAGSACTNRRDSAHTPPHSTACRTDCKPNRIRLQLQILHLSLRVSKFQLQLQILHLSLRVAIRGLIQEIPVAITNFYLILRVEIWGLIQGRGAFLLPLHRQEIDKKSTRKTPGAGSLSADAFSCVVIRLTTSPVRCSWGFLIAAVELTLQSKSPIAGCTGLGPYLALSSQSCQRCLKSEINSFNRKIWNKVSIDIVGLNMIPKTWFQKTITTDCVLLNRATYLHSMQETIFGLSKYCVYDPQN